MDKTRHRLLMAGLFALICFSPSLSSITKGEELNYGFNFANDKELMKEFGVIYFPALQEKYLTGDINGEIVYETIPGVGTG